MTLFEFLMMIASVVVAFGMTEIVSGWGRMMRTRAKVEPYWLHLGWTIVILVLLIEHWVGMWTYRELLFDNIAQVVSLVIPSIFGVLAAYAISPDIPVNGTLDVRAYYMAKRVPVFGSLATFWAATSLPDFLIAGPDNVEFNVGIIVGAILLIGLALTKHPWVHFSVLALVTIAVVLFMAISIEEIQSRFHVS